MRRLLPATLAVVAVGCGVAAAWPAPAPSAPAARARPTVPVLDARRLPRFLSGLVAQVRLTAGLDAALDDPALGPARSQACLVVQGPVGADLYSRQATMPLLPASNLKLLTATAALARLGAGDRFRTEVRAQRPPTNGVLAGDVWLVGGGDPLLAVADFAAQGGYEHQPRLASPLEALADRLVAAGVRQIQGRLIGDESRYDAQRAVPTWKPSYVSDFEIGPLSALTVDDGFAQWRPQPVRAPSPALNAVNTLAQLLQARGVTVAGAGEGKVPAGTAVVTSVESPTLGDVVGDMLRQSDNLTAELLTKELGFRFGGAGTTAAGLAVTRASLQSLGLPLAGMAAADGSGLDRSDRATCGLLLTALTRAGPGGPIGAGLPLAGRDGTLWKRFGGTAVAGRLRAKTGSLEGVAGFSGWATGKGGETLTFSLLVNGLPREAVGRALEDRVAAALVAYPQAPDPATLAP